MVVAPGLSAGKTSVALALTAALTRAGRHVQTFQAGPEFHAPALLAQASGRPCFALDSWQALQSHLLHVWNTTIVDCEVAIINGNEGLFNGVALARRLRRGSDAELSRWLDASLILIVDATGMGRGFAALVRGLVQFEPGLQFLGVVAENVADDKHRAVLQSALAEARLPPLLGAWHADGPPALPDESVVQLFDEELERWANAGERFLKSAEKSYRIHRAKDHFRPQSDHRPRTTDRSSVFRVGIARDEAFSCLLRRAISLHLPHKRIE